MKLKSKLLRLTLFSIILLGGISNADTNPIIGGISNNSSSTAVGEGSIAIGENNSSIGKDSFSSGNNMTKEEYLQFLAENQAKLEEIKNKLKEKESLNNELNDIKSQNELITDALNRIENYRNAITNKENLIETREPLINEEITTLETQRIDYSRQIEDLNTRINILQSFDFSDINGENLDDKISEMAIRLKDKMEKDENGNRLQFIKDYGEDGLPVSDYENLIRQYIAKPSNELIAKELGATFNNTLDTYMTHDIIKVSSYSTSVKNDKSITFGMNTVGLNRSHNVFIDVRNKNGIYYNTLNYNDANYNVITGFGTYNLNIIKDNIDNNSSNLKFISYDDFISKPLSKEKFKIIDKFNGGFNNILNIDETYLRTNPETDDFEDFEFTEGYNINSETMQLIKNTYNEVNSWLVEKNRLSQEINDNPDDTRGNEVRLLKISKLNERFNNLENDPSFKEFKDTFEIPEGSLKNLKNYFDKYTINRLFKLGIIDEDYNIYNENLIPLLDESSKSKYNDYLNSTMLGLKAEFEEFNILRDKYIDNKNILNQSGELVNKFKKEIDRLKSLERDASTSIEVKRNEIEGYRKEINNLKELIQGENLDEGEANRIKNEIIEKQNAINTLNDDIETIKSTLTEVSGGQNALANGYKAVALGESSIALGYDSFSRGLGSISIGKGNIVDGDKSIAIGYENVIKGTGSGVFGDPNEVYGDNNYVIGNDNRIGLINQPRNNVFILGSNVDATNVENAVVLGNNSTAVSNSVSVGSSGNERQIKHVKEGTEDTDAVNVKQLKDYVSNFGGNSNPLNNNVVNEFGNRLNVLDSQNNAGIAASMAMASLPQVSGNNYLSVSAGISTYRGEQALALGLSGQTKSKNLVYKLNASIDKKAKFGLSLGVNYSFLKFDDIISDKVNEKSTNNKDDMYNEINTLRNMVKDLQHKLDNINESNNKINTDAIIKTKDLIINGYEVNEYRLTESQIIELNKLISNIGNKKVDIIGYADTKGNDKYNLQLGLHRAREVAKYLASKGITIDKIKSSGFNTITNGNDYTNRRVEIIIK